MITRKFCTCLPYLWSPCFRWYFVLPRWYRELSFTVMGYQRFRMVRTQTVHERHPSCSKHIRYTRYWQNALHSSNCIGLTCHSRWISLLFFKGIQWKMWDYLCSGCCVNCLRSISVAVPHVNQAFERVDSVEFVFPFYGHERLPQEKDPFKFMFMFSSCSSVILFQKVRSGLWHRALICVVFTSNDKKISGCLRKVTSCVDT